MTIIDIICFTFIIIFAIISLLVFGILIYGTIELLIEEWNENKEKKNEK